MYGFRQLSQTPYLRIQAYPRPQLHDAATPPQGCVAGAGGDAQLGERLSVREIALPTVSIVHAVAADPGELQISTSEAAVILIGRVSESATLALDGGEAQPLAPGGAFRASMRTGAVLGLSGGALTLVAAPRHLAAAREAANGGGDGALSTAPDAAIDLLLAQAEHLSGHTLSPRLARACEAGLLALLAVAGETGATPPDTTSSLYHLIVADIAANCRDHDYGVAQVARRFKINVRTLQKMFQKQGSTLKEQITTARLDIAGTALLDPANAGRKVSDIAFESGFNDIATFNRLFRKAYGRSPSAFRADATGTGAAAAHDMASPAPDDPAEGEG